MCWVSVGIKIKDVTMVTIKDLGGQADHNSLAPALFPELSRMVSCGESETVYILRPGCAYRDCILWSFLPLKAQQLQLAERLNKTQSWLAVKVANRKQIVEIAYSPSRSTCVSYVKCTTPVDSLWTNFQEHSLAGLPLA